MKKFILFLAFSFCCIFSFGQNKKIDSLMKVLKNSKLDTNQINTLNVIASEFRNNSPLTAIFYTKKAISYATKIGYNKGIINSYLVLANSLMNMGKYEDALMDANVALNLCNDHIKSVNKNVITSALEQKMRATNIIGVIYMYQSKYTEALKNYTISLRISEQTKDKNSIANSYNNIGGIYYSQGNYPEALKYYFNSLKFLELLNDKYGIAALYNNIGGIYSQQSNFPEALKYYFKNLKISQEIGDKNGIAFGYGNIGGVYFRTGNFNEALKNFDLALKISEEINDQQGVAYSYMNIGGIYEAQNKNSEALNNDLKSLKISLEIGDKSSIATLYNNIGNIYMKKNNRIKAALYLNKSLSVSNETRNLEWIKNNFQSLSQLDSSETNYKEAFNHYKLYIAYRDSMFNEENTKKIVQTQMQYDFDKKEAATKAATDKQQALAKAEIQKQKIIRNSIGAGTGILVLSTFFSFLFYKRKREASFKTEVSEVEMKALRSQMNPHFIFNSLNSIKRYMANHDNKTAEDYLTKFASVMRMILENSEQKEIPLKEDLKALELYMQLESLRMKKKFTYEIKVDENIDQENTLIPPLILQPFVENSIWHGIAEKEGEGKITIYIAKNEEMIECTVEDNGVGRIQSKASQTETALTEKKSLGMKITNARIDILNKIKKSKAGVELVDLAEGMRVTVKLPLELSF